MTNLNIDPFLLEVQRNSLIPVTDALYTLGSAAYRYAYIYSVASAFSSLALSATSNQITFGSGTTTTFTVPTPAASRVITFPDAGSSSSAVLSEGSLTINGSKTFSSALTISPTTLQLILGTTKTVTINSTQPAASRIHLIPDPLTNSTFAMLDGNQTFTGIQTISNTTDSSSVSTGSIISSGGAGFAKKVYIGAGASIVGGQIDLGGASDSSQINVGNSASAARTANFNTSMNGNTTNLGSSHASANTTLSGGSKVTIEGPTFYSTSTDSTSTSTGTITCAGGMGLTKSLYVGGTIDAPMLHYARISVSAAEIKTLATVGKSLVAALAGYTHVMYSCSISYNYNTTAFGVTGGQYIIIGYGGAVGSPSRQHASGYIVNGFLDQTASMNMLFAITSVNSTNAMAVNNSLILTTNSAGNPTLGDGTLTVNLIYGSFASP